MSVKVDAENKQKSAQVAKEELKEHMKAIEKVMERLQTC